MSITHKHPYSDSEKISQIKSAINTRKYAHPAEISLLWKNAMNSSFNLSWSKVMLTACISTAIVLMLTSY